MNTNSGSGTTSRMGGAGTNTNMGNDRPVGMTSASESEGVMGLLQKVGIDEATVQSTVQHWRSQLGTNVGKQIEEADLLELLDKARDLARGSASRLKSSAQSNPTMFYGGVVALIAGAGLLAAAAKGGSEESPSTNKTGGDTPSVLV
ncbi:MAG TPA: hypothetical protein VJ276_21670 [Thermoanaerobaculia bacterium]|nr:hypothetical protein [Thermoanaerobaculia bacterium]